MSGAAIAALYAFLLAIYFALWALASPEHALVFALVLTTAGLGRARNA